MKVDCFIQLRVLGMFYTTRGRFIGDNSDYAGEAKLFGIVLYRSLRIMY